MFRTLARLVPFVIFAVDGEAAIFLPRHSSGPTLIELILDLNGLTLGECHVDCKSK
jgi:hypothetical protein